MVFQDAIIGVSKLPTTKQRKGHSMCYDTPDLQRQKNVSLTHDLRPLSGYAKVAVHVWAKGIAKNIAGEETHITLVRPNLRSSLALVVREASFREADLVFKPDATLAGFGGRTMSWIEVEASNLYVRLQRDGEKIPFLRWYDGLRGGLAADYVTG